MVDAVHRELILEHGGRYGIRDEGMIESALGRPRNRWSYGDNSVDMADLAAAYGYGLASDHGYIDGNKRIALAAMHLFLAINGLVLVTSEPEEVAVMLEVASGEMAEDVLAAWIRTRLVPR